MTNRLRTALVMYGLTFLMMVSTGCSTASWIVHHNASANDLIITEGDVDAMLEELSISRSEESGDILYNKATDRYELTPDIFQKAIRDGIIRKIQDIKIRAFLENYHRESFTDAVRKDIGTSGAVILLLGVLGALFY